MSAGFQIIKISISIAILCVVACTDKKGKLPQPLAEQAPVSNGCDTTFVSYSKHVAPVLQTNCYSCHSTAVTGSSGGFDLENFVSLKNYLNYQFQADGVYGSKFTHIINQSLGVIPMPPTAKMSSCEIGLITKWIREGAPQN